MLSISNIHTYIQHLYGKWDAMALILIENVKWRSKNICKPEIHFEQINAEQIHFGISLQSVPECSS